MTAGFWIATVAAFSSASPNQSLFGLRMFPFFAWQEWEGFAFEAPERVDALGATVLFVPFWLLFLVAAIPTALLFLRDRRKIPAGHCRHCDYDLRGIASGICPECGNASPPPTNPPDMPPPSSGNNAKVG
ncbi:MAG: hypothetical protein IPK83_06125 [Planctomycetes bacterium]|nr:hypothetical protein [Planctomycetota bacterium]